MTARKATTATPEGSAGVRTLALADILTPDAFKIRKRTDAATVARYAAALRAGAEFPPVVVGNIGGALILLDGYHRTAAHAETGRPRILASAEEGRWLAAEANLRHGKPLNRAEVREAFKAFVRAKRHRDPRGRLLTLREVASRFGMVGHTTVLRWFRSYFPHIARQYAGEEQGGGTRDSRMKPLDFGAMATGARSEAIAAARGVACPTARGHLVEAFRAAAAEVEAAGPFVPPEPPDF